MLDFVNLPQEVFSHILSRFCDGKTISTLLIVAQGNRKLSPSAFSMVRGALVHRYIGLAASVGVSVSSGNDEEHDEMNPTHVEIQEILDIVREDIRLSVELDDDSLLMTRKLSEWCAILDYFEAQIPLQQYIVWVGAMQIPYGSVQTYFSTPHWSIGALRYWRLQEEADLSFTSSSGTRSDWNIPGIPYASVLARDHNSHRRTKMQAKNLELAPYSRLLQTDLRRTCLVLIREIYETSPTLVICAWSSLQRSFDRSHERHSFLGLKDQTDEYEADDDDSDDQQLHYFARQRSIRSGQNDCLMVSWDTTCGEDFETAMETLGEDVIRIMNYMTENDQNRRLTFQQVLHCRHVENLVLDHEEAEIDLFFG
jgi:hypothetical protein